MPRYRYSASDLRGVTVEGEIDAETADAASEALRGGGLEIRSLVAVEERAEPVEPSGRKLTADESRVFAEQLAGLTKAGLPLHSGLRAMAEELSDGALRSVLFQLAGRLEAGDPLEKALEEVGGRLPSHLRGLVEVGARSGRLGAVLGEFVTYAQLGASLRHALLLGVAYPVLLVMAFLTLFVFLNFTAVTGFESIFMDFGIDLPIMTVALIQVSHAVTKSGPLVVTGPLIGIVALWISGRVLLDASSRRQMAYSLPLLGPMWRWIGLAEFSHYLGLLVESEIPLATAVTLAADGTGDAALAKAAEQMSREIADGRSLAVSASWWWVFPFGFTRMLEWAEGHQSLAETLHMAGDIFEARARSQGSFIASVFAIGAILFVIWGVGFTVVALFLPLISLISKLSG